MLKGEYEYTLDDRGRLVMPPRFRAPMGERFVATRGFDGCVVLYPLLEWQRVEAKLAAEPLENRRLVRYLLGSAVECELDRQGRFLLPQPLREHAGIHRDAVVVGLVNKVEVWSKERWHAYLQSTAEDEAALLEGLRGLSL
ncbi:MAG: division/cell wall cluster transcriptional repressor MraZ [Armatimonadota bacterium]|nr:division/cell wall cluster transcriptional repressor MraZ [Armatimonadota bacterium]MDR5688286.1 division/cell wall cluster transcriptional repressor MraZ [Armatimonadota bacterium]MDR7389219.1 division/cell wall cluster transcriptional repressor MraZ [Armatimonadota bacterium]MDR7391687.1 division/cell wall cluster transcriptional repressor MraZ [Armatimonadota bacterium]MDR7396487.1 division/cell wall cluster transcriptional repressor MraZ [Armatimonadota bacterium]